MIAVCICICMALFCCLIGIMELCKSGNCTSVPTNLVLNAICEPQFLAWKFFVGLSNVAPALHSKFRICPIKTALNHLLLMNSHWCMLFVRNNVLWILRSSRTVILSLPQPKTQVLNWLVFGKLCLGGPMDLNTELLKVSVLRFNYCVCVWEREIYAKV